MIAIDLSLMLSAKDKEAIARAAEIEAAMGDARSYLAATDWYVARFAETGTPIPDEVRAKRDAARSSL